MLDGVKENSDRRIIEDLGRPISLPLSCTPSNPSYRSSNRSSSVARLAGSAVIYQAAAVTGRASRT